MAKRKTKKTQDPRVANRSERSAPFTPEKIHAEVVAARAALAEVDALARAMEKKGIDSVPVDGQTLLARSRMQIKKFKLNLERAIGMAELRAEKHDTF